MPVDFFPEPLAAPALPADFFAAPLAAAALPADFIAAALPADLFLALPVDFRLADRLAAAALRVDLRLADRRAPRLFDFDRALDLERERALFDLDRELDCPLPLFAGTWELDLALDLAADFNLDDLLGAALALTLKRQIEPWVGIIALIHP